MVYLVDIVCRLLRNIKDYRKDAIKMKLFVVENGLVRDILRWIVGGVLVLTLL
jgi:hypothetical protein